MTDDDKALVAELRKRRVYKDGVRRQPRKHEREAADRIEALEAENGRLKAIVHGWHWLAVGPDEMGDYYTEKHLIKASEPYASPALKEIGGD